MYSKPILLEYDDSPPRGEIKNARGADDQTAVSAQPVPHIEMSRPGFRDRRKEG